MQAHFTKTQAHICPKRFCQNTMYCGIIVNTKDGKPQCILQLNISRAKRGYSPERSCIIGKKYILNSLTPMLLICIRGIVRFVILIPFICIDVNECNESPSPCHSDATCTNTAGSYICECQHGFIGNGTHCTGKWSLDIEIIVCCNRWLKFRSTRTCCPTLKWSFPFTGDLKKKLKKSNIFLAFWLLLIKIR